MIQAAVIPDEVTIRTTDLEAFIERTMARADRRFLTVEAAATYVSLSADSIRRLISSGKLQPYRPVKGRLLIDRIELESVVRASTAQPRKGRGLNRQTG